MEILVLAMAIGFMIKIPSAIRHDRMFFRKKYKVDKRSFGQKWLW